MAAAIEKLNQGDGRAGITGGGKRSVYLMDCAPVWGCAATRGRGGEMEDARAALPHFADVPVRLLASRRDLDGLGLYADALRLPAHLFGVFDGHGGAEVANYCRQRLHVVLSNELRKLARDLWEMSEVDMKEHWDALFSKCFQRVDDEVSGRASRLIDGVGEFRSEPVAAENVGSTAVVAVVCSSHVVVANCGDSRIVLCRGKEPVALSIDHKPDRKDERARIEAEGGKVIQWNGYRVSGILAMSRSIADTSTLMSRAHPYAPVDDSLTLQGPLCRVCEENNEPEGKSSSCEGKAVGFVYSSAGKDSVLVTAWGSGQLQIDALADEIQPQWSIGIPTRLDVDSHGHTKSVAMICDSNSQDSLVLRSHRTSSTGSNVKSNTDAVWMEHSPPLLRLAIVDLALSKTSNGSSLSLFLDPLVPERFYCAHGGGLDMITLHFLPFSYPEMASTPPSVHPVLTTGNNETDSPFLSGFVTITDAYGDVHLVGITCPGVCFVVGMKGWKERTPLQLDIDNKSIKDVESSTTGMISRELIAGPDPPILPSSSSLRSLTPDSIEGKSTLHHYIKVFHEYYVEYGHKVFIELKEHADYLKTEMEDKHKRLQAVKQSLLSIEAKDQDLNKRIDRAFKVYNLLEKRIESFKMLPAANKKPLSQAEQEFKAQLDWFADVELDALCSSITAMCARMKRFAHPSMGSAAGTGMPPCQTPKAGRSHVSDSQMSLMKSSLERLSLLNEENNLKLRLIEHELKNQEQ